MNLKNKRNDYQDALGNVFDACPKAVLGAIAASALTCGGDRIERARECLLKEWWILYRAEIVPQKPPFPEPPDSL